MKRKASPLPDLDDDEFARRLKPLEAVMFPHARLPEIHNSVDPEGRQTGHPDMGLTGYIKDRGDTKSTSRDLRLSAEATTHQPDIQDSGIPEGHKISSSTTETSYLRNIRNTGSPDDQTSGSPIAPTNVPPRGNDSTQTESQEETKGRWSGVLEAAERLVHIEQTRGPKRRFEYLIPQRVGDALAKEAALQGKSATVLLLEVLREAGYPVIPEDLIDLRKARRR